jgi:hypothetical protein
MMDAISTLIEQTRHYCEQVLPASQSMGTWPTGVIVVLFGLGLAMFGAKSAHIVLTLGFALGGALLGHAFAQAADFNPVFFVIVMGGLAGVIGYQTFRLWVGVLASLVLAALCLTAFGYVRVAPEVTEFNAALQRVQGDTPMALAASDEEGDAEEGIHILGEDGVWTDDHWFEGFWAHLEKRDPEAGNWGGAIAIVAGMVGLVLGLMALRPSLVVTTSMIGTLCVFAGGMAIAAAAWPSAYKWCLQQPVLTGAALGAFAVASLVIQGRMTRSSEGGSSGAGGEAAEAA